MKELDIDWADYIRKVIEDKIRVEMRRKAAKTTDMIKAKTKRGYFDSAESIREDRDGRKINDGIHSGNEHGLLLLDVIMISKAQSLITI